jgi:hypothetical protein
VGQFKLIHYRAMRLSVDGGGIVPSMIYDVMIFSFLVLALWALGMALLSMKAKPVPVQIIKRPVGFAPPA